MPDSNSCTVKTIKCPGRVSCSKILSKLGAVSSRSLDSKDCFRGSLSSICHKTSEVRSKRNHCKYYSYVKFIRRGKQTFRKRCYRKCTEGARRSRVLQYLLHSTEERRGSTSNIELETSKCLFKKRSFQNGNSAICDSSSPSRGLGSHNRSQGCVPTHTHISSSQKISKVLCPEKTLPVLFNALRLSNRSENIHKSNGSCGGTSSSSEHSHFHVSGRLVNEKSDEIGSSRPVDKDITPSCGLGSFNQSSKIQFNSNSDHFLFGSSIQSTEGTSVPFRGTISSNSGNCNLSDLQEKGACSYVPSSARVDGFMHRHSSISTSVHETYPVISPMFLATSQTESSMFSASPSSFVRPSQMVAGQKESFQRNAPSSNVSDSCFMDGRKSDRLGGSLGSNEISCIRKVDRGIQTETYKFPRNAGSLECFDTISSNFSRQDSSGQMRQCNCGVLHQQTRGYQVNSVVCSSLEHDAMVHSTQHQVNCSPYSRQDKLCCRQAIEGEEVDKINRMDSETVCSSSNFSLVRDPKYRLICDTSEQENSSVLQSLPRSSGSGLRCVSCRMEKHVCLCFSPSNFTSQGSQENSTGGMCGDSNSTNSSLPVMVSSVNRTSSRDPSKAASNRRSLDTKRRSVYTSKPKSPKSCSLEIVKHTRSSRRFSEEARKFLDQSKRESTKRLYNARIQIYSDWCSERNINPTKAAVEEIADFLVFLVNVKKFKITTIIGYRSAISSFHKGWSHSKVGTNSDISDLIKGMYNAKPEIKPLIPNWDLPSVLWRLCDPPFEPLDSCELKFLTWKTVFLLALASASRISEIHALSVKDGNLRFERHGIRLLPDLQFLGKTQRLKNPWIPIFIPSFKEYATEEKDLKLCPCRALKMYIKRTQMKRSVDNIESLFLTYQKNVCKAASKNTIARWIVSLIRYIYEQLNLNLFYVRAHDTRRLSTSWALFNGASLVDIMRTAHWKLDSTFTSFYMKDVPKNDSRFAKAAILDTAQKK